MVWACLMGCIGRQLVHSAGEPAGELDVGLFSMVKCETLLQGWLQQKPCLARRELEPNASALLPLPFLHITII